MNRVAIHLLLFVVASFYCNAQDSEVSSQESHSNYPDCELLDLAFAFDASSSIEAEYFNQSVQFARKVITELNVGLNATRVSAIRFDRFPFPLWSFSDSKDAPYVDGRLASMSYGSGGRKRLASLLSHLGFRTFSSSNGDRDDVPDMAVIFTDGLANDRPQRRVSRLKRQGIRIAIVQVGEETNNNLIEQIVSEPRSENYYHLGDENALASTLRDYAIGLCPRGGRI